MRGSATVSVRSEGDDREAPDEGSTCQRPRLPHADRVLRPGRERRRVSLARGGGVKPALLQADSYGMATTFSPALLREARTLAGLTGADLAARADLHPVTVRNYERGMFCPPE